MRVRRLFAAVAVAMLIAHAGCAGIFEPGADPTPSAEASSTAGAPSAGAADTATQTRQPTAATDPPRTATSSATAEPALAVDASAVFERVERLLGENATEPTVEALPRTGSVPSSSPSRLETMFGATDYSGNTRACGPIPRAETNASHLAITTGGLTAAEQELLLVHEYVHVIQAQSGNLEPGAEMRESLTRSYGETTFSRAIVEGAAVYVTDVYAREHDLAWDGRRPLSMRECRYERPSRGVRDLFAKYYFGGRYFTQRLDSPRNLSTVYRKPPYTSEELIHGLERGSEPPAALNVTVETGGEWSVDERDNRGELALRTVLASQLAEPRAGSAAAGWGEDVSVTFRDGIAGAGIAWIVRFDEPAEATEFADAVDDYADRVAERDETSVRASRVSPETVALFGGTDSFVANASARGTDGNVTVLGPERSPATDR